MTEDRVILGKFGAVHGVRGWIKVYSSSPPASKLLDHPNWQIKHAGQWQQLIIENHRFHGETLLVKLTQVDTPEEARLFTNDLIAVDRSELPTLAEGEYYWADLEGLSVMTEQGDVLGKIDHLMETGANDVMIIKGERRRILPYTNDCVRSIDIEKGEMLVNWDPAF